MLNMPLEQEFKLLGGTQQISETLAQPLHVMHDRNVVAIEQSDSSVTVRAFDSSFAVSTYTARRVVVATPPHISASFQYSPPLPPNKQKLLQHLTQGHMIKTVITYPAAFWRHSGFSGEVVSSSGAPQRQGWKRHLKSLTYRQQILCLSAMMIPSPMALPILRLPSFASLRGARVLPPANSRCSSGSSLSYPN